MTIIQNTHNAAPQDIALPRALVLLLSAGAGLAVASLYYSQPALGLLEAAFHTGDRLIGLVPTLTQLGYAAGILFLIPLGDRFDRRRIILAKSAALVLALALTACAPGYGFLLFASVLVGISATLAQDLVPAAAILAPAHRRGHIVGSVMTGLLLGILLSRVVSGVVAEWLGWRIVYILAAVSVVGVLAACWRLLPHFPVHSELGYPALLASLRHLWDHHAVVRRSTLAQAALSVAFSAFWSALALMLQHSYHLGSSVAGAFGLAGAAGSVAAPLAGRLADHKGPRVVAASGIAIAALCFASMLALPALPRAAQLALLVLASVGFDFGVQATLVAHQTIVYSADHTARSRLNAILFTGMFLGMAAGSSLSGIVLSRWGWTGISLFATAFSLLALFIATRAPRGRRSRLRAAVLPALLLTRRS